MSTTDTELKRAQIEGLQADTARAQALTVETQARAIEHLVRTNAYHPDAIVAAVVANNLSLLLDEPTDPTPKELAA